MLCSYVTVCPDRDLPTTMAAMTPDPIPETRKNFQLKWHV